MASMTDAIMAGIIDKDYAGDYSTAREDMKEAWRMYCSGIKSCFHREVNPNCASCMKGISDSALSLACRACGGQIISEEDRVNLINRIYKTSEETQTGEAFEAILDGMKAEREGAVKSVREAFRQLVREKAGDVELDDTSIDAWLVAEAASEAREILEISLPMHFISSFQTHLESTPHDVKSAMDYSEDPDSIEYNPDEDPENKINCLVRWEGQEKPRYVTILSQRDFRYHMAEHFGGADLFVSVKPDILHGTDPASMDALTWNHARRAAKNGARRW